MFVLLFCNKQLISAYFSFMYYIYIAFILCYFTRELFRFNTKEKWIWKIHYVLPKVFVIHTKDYYMSFNLNIICYIVH